MSAAVSLITLLVCSECLPGLVANGAEHVTGGAPREIALDTKCEAHGPIGAPAADRVVRVTPAHDEAIMAARRNTAIAPLDHERGDRIEDVPIVAGVAATLLTRHELDPASDDAIFLAVTRARRIVAAARGE